MDLAEEIKQFYINNSGDLSRSRRFHFASRLAAWENSQTAIRILQELEDFMLPNDSQTVISNLLSSPVQKIYGEELRKGYFEKYPRLFGIHNALFRVRHLKEIYGIDTREVFLEIVGRNELDAMYRQLINDGEAIRMLSRFAVDYIYLYEILFGINSRLDPSLFLSLKHAYDLKNEVQLHLFIYLFTHSIIADTNFYVQNVPSDRLPVYRAMLEELDETIKGRDDIKLDNKFEYLVACRICDRQSPLASEINNQAVKSLSFSGKFIVDKLNDNVNGKLNSFAGSEHRNVLFVMSNSPFKPGFVPIT